MARMSKWGIKNDGDGLSGKQGDLQCLPVTEPEDAAIRAVASRPSSAIPTSKGFYHDPSEEESWAKNCWTPAEWPEV
jgi:hypothetical protein